MRSILILAVMLVAASLALAADEPAPKLGHNEVACNRDKGLCLVNMADLAEQQQLLVAATRRVSDLEEELAAEKARKTKRCAVVIPQRNTAVR